MFKLNIGQHIVTEGSNPQSPLGLQGTPSPPGREGRSDDEVLSKVDGSFKEPDGQDKNKNSKYCVDIYNIRVACSSNIRSFLRCSVLPESYNNVILFQ